MAQITSGFRSILSYPFVYSALQTLMGGGKSRADFVSSCVRPFSGMRVLDIGCGPADILAYIPEVNYWGFDISRPYIENAKKRFGLQGNFYCKLLDSDDLRELPSFDLVLALGLLHHLDDFDAQNVIELAHKALKPGGRLLTVDPCYEPSQNFIARFLIKNDRGQNVRDKQGYQSLLSRVFPSVRAEVRHQSWIPYTHCITECIP
jgi:SAM-dependent methyltransferase